jgi:hypothetical protein
MKRGLHFPFFKQYTVSRTCCVSPFDTVPAATPFLVEMVYNWPMIGVADVV